VLSKFHKNNDKTYGHLQCFDFNISDKEKEYKKNIIVEKGRDVDKQKADLEKRLQIVFNSNVDRQKDELAAENRLNADLIKRIQTKRHHAQDALKQRTREENDKKIREDKKTEEIKQLALKELALIRTGKKKAKLDLELVESNIIHCKVNITMVRKNIHEMKSKYESNGRSIGLQGFAVERSYLSKQNQLAKYVLLLGKEEEKKREIEKNLKSYDTTMHHYSLKNPTIRVDRY
jgi:hypothetical protein